MVVQSRLNFSSHLGVKRHLFRPWLHGSTTHVKIDELLTKDASQNVRYLLGMVYQLKKIVNVIVFIGIKKENMLTKLKITNLSSFNKRLRYNHLSFYLPFKPLTPVILFELINRCRECIWLITAWITVYRHTILNHRFISWFETAGNTLGPYLTVLARKGSSIHIKIFNSLIKKPEK